MLQWLNCGMHNIRYPILKGVEYKNAKYLNDKKSK